MGRASSSGTSGGRNHSNIRSADVDKSQRLIGRGQVVTACSGDGCRGYKLVVVRRSTNLQRGRCIEYRGGIGAEKFIPDGECRILPTGTDFFKTYYGSAERFGLVNVPAQEAYYFEKMSEDDDQWTIDAETNMANMVLNPAVVVRGYSSN